jgi:CHAD domain-containing protein
MTQPVEADTGSVTNPGSAVETSARGALDVYVRVQCEVVMNVDAQLREGVDEVHDTRVAIRRLRSTLRVFAPVFVPLRAAELNTDLTWYAALLGAVRDREVLRLRLGEAVAALPSGLVLGPVAEHIDQQLLSEQTFHHDELTRAMDGDRYKLLLVSLSDWASNPPYAIVVDDPHLLVGLAKKGARKAKRRLAEAHSAHDTATALHRARKAAKRARYSAELVEPLGARKASARIRHFKHLQSALGTYQDSVLAAEVLRRLGAGAGTLPGHNGFTYGLLYDREIRAGEAAREEAAAL